MNHDIYYCIPKAGHMAIGPVVNRSAEEIIYEQNLAWSVIIYHCLCLSCILMKSICLQKQNSHQSEKDITGTSKTFYSNKFLGKHVLFIISWKINPQWLFMCFSL